MKKKTMVAMIVVLSLSLIAAGSVFARWGGGYGTKGAGIECGYGDCGVANCYRENVDPEVLEKFREETQALREELGALKAELVAEYDKDSPDADRIGQLKKDMIDVQTGIQKVADKYDIDRGGKGRRAGRNFRGRYNCGSPGNCF